MENYIIGNKKRVARFVIFWFKISGEAFLNTENIWSFVDELTEFMAKDNSKYNNSFDEELNSFQQIKDAKLM